MSLDEAIAAVLAPFEEVRVAWLFGSQVTGRARTDSDLDLALVFARDVSPRAREDVRRRLVDGLAQTVGQLGERADILDMERADSAVGFAVIRDGRLVLARSEDERVEAMVRAMRRYDDEAPYRALYREAALRAARGLAGSSHER